MSFIRQNQCGYINPKGANKNIIKQQRKDFATQQGIQNVRISENGKKWICQERKKFNGTRIEHKLVQFSPG